jgi:hypothetical protein
VAFGEEASDQGVQDEGEKPPEPSEDAPEVVSGSSEDCVCGIAGTALEEAASEMA